MCNKVHQWQNRPTTKAAAAAAMAAASTAFTSHQSMMYTKVEMNGGGGGGRDSLPASYSQESPSHQKLPRFGMNKGVRINPGQIYWQGKYVDQSLFFKVSVRRHQRSFALDNTFLFVRME